MGNGRKNPCNYYCCRTYVDLGKKYCTSHSITEKCIESIVLQDIRAMLGRVEIDEERAKEHFFRERAKCGERNRLSDEKQLRSLNDRLAELDNPLPSTFEEKGAGTSPASGCANLCQKYQAEKESTQKRIAELEKRLAEADTIEADAEDYIARLKRYGKCEQLTREMCLQLIEFITVGEKTDGDEPRHIHIYYKLISNQTLAEYRKQTTK